MQVLFLSPHSDPLAHPGEPDSGGQCIYEHQLASSLSKHEGVSVTVFCRYRSGYPINEQVNTDYHIYRLECGGKDFLPKEQLEPILPEFVDLLTIHIDIRQSFIVHAHYWDGIKSALILKKRLQINFPIIWTPHSLAINKRSVYKGIENERRFNLIPRKLWENYGVILSDSVQISSNPEKHDLITHYDALEEQIIINPPGVELAVFRVTDRFESRHYFNLSAEEFIISSAGRLTPEKGFHNTIHAAYRLKQLTDKFKLLLVGGSPRELSESEEKYLSQLQRLVHDYELQDQVIFQRAVSHSDMKYLYGSSDIYLCLSEYEPFGLSVIEAMAAGTSVITTNNGGPADIITDNHNGFLVKSHDYENIATILHRLINQPELRQMISQQASEYALQQFSWERTAKDTLTNYERLLQSNQGNKLELINNSYFLQRNL